MRDVYDLPDATLLFKATIHRNNDLELFFTAPLLNLFRKHLNEEKNGFLRK